MVVAILLLLLLLELMISAKSSEMLLLLRNYPEQLGKGQFVSTQTSAGAAGAGAAAANASTTNTAPVLLHSSFTNGPSLALLSPRPRTAIVSLCSKGGFPQLLHATSAIPEATVP
jgi:hypothetical protein